MAVVKVEAPKEKLSEFYPRWVDNPDPNAPEKLKRIIVKDHIHHGALLGKVFNPDATEVIPNDDWDDDGGKPIQTGQEAEPQKAKRGRPPKAE
jgi:hypothetical protein